jgi:hypothetical protein
LGAFLLILGIAVNYKISKNYELTAGIFSMENYYLYSMYIAKPWCKLHVFALGILSGTLFVQNSEYK